MYKYLLIILLLTGYAFTATAQESDTSAVKAKVNSIQSKRPDTVVNSTFIPKIKKEKVFHPDSTHSPQKAVIRSLIIPGWGQLYNHRWWKVPVIYSGIGLLGWVVIYNVKYYKEFLALSKYRENGILPKPTDPYYAEAQIYATS